MSDQFPYATRLRWDGRTGFARLDGRQVQLQAPPVLAGAAVHALDFVPCVRIAEVEPRPCDAPRTMTPAEVAAAWELLASLTGPASAP